MKQSIQALSLAPDVNNWLTNSRHPRVLHVFDHACNLINERGEVLSIVTPQIGNGPFNIVVNDKVLFSEHLNLQSPISNSANQLHLGDLTVHTTDAKLWNPQPNWQRLYARKRDISNQLTQLQITNSPNLGSFDTSAGVHSGLLNHPGLPLPQSPVSSLFSSLAIADLASSVISVQKLAGLGVGLTPSGDDFIMGAIYAAWIIHPFEIASSLAREVAATAAPLTTSLSAAWLRSAGEGEAGILWHEFFDALIAGGRTESPLGIGNPTYLKEAIDNILAIGETSGADALAGFTSVFVYWIEKTGFSHG